MSDTLGLQGHIYTEHPVQPHVEKQKASGFVIKILIFLLLGLLAGETIFYLFIIPYTTIAKVSFSGMQSVSSDMLQQAAGLAGTEKWIQIDSQAVLRRLTQYPIVAQAKVTKKFPDKVFIEITERTPAAILLATVGNRTIPIEIDKTGTVFKINTDLPQDTLPIVSGLEFSAIRAGIKVHKQLVPLFKQLDILYKKKSILLREISEIRIEQKKYGGFDLIIYPVQTKVKVRTDSALNEDRLQYMMLLLDVIRGLNIDSRVEELDVRAGTAAYRLRGDKNE